MDERTTPPMPDPAQCSRRTGPGTGNTSGDDLPSDAKTQRDTRDVEGRSAEDNSTDIPGRNAEGAGETGGGDDGAAETLDPSDFKE